MKRRLKNIGALLLYLMVMGMLLEFDWNIIIRPKPFLSVVIGAIILTASQYKKTFAKEEVIHSLRWNVLFASFLTTLMSMLSFTSAKNLDNINISAFGENFLPLLYGTILYLILNLIFEEERIKNKKEFDENPKVQEKNLFDTIVADKVFREFTLTNRECHVAIKMLENISNKEIAEQLYISEATVKKHIQNIYQKLEVSDREGFRKIYLEKAQKVDF
ncbi:LuxR C-terminal-related transcriptional regulator [Desnuesiella massiliensis]|uniref:LuxR C-terminal-related transcriptional regulator n=1 Tax=Desnuesiella massiliensis TaxID=1650662 RepID=UPI0006E16D14|nr:LuxR C-terminal-related transcriptional regulator [Desnuesiella massiliensis]